MDVAPLHRRATDSGCSPLCHWGLANAQAGLANTIDSGVVLCGGMAVAGVTLDSPMHELSEQLFWVHMTQHEALVLVSAPLLVLGRPLVPFLWALPAPWRNAAGDVSKSRAFKRAWLWISAPVSAWLLHAAALWAWHAPVLFTAAVENDFWHAAQHISFLGTALLFWWALLDGHGGRF